jgi:hypothetical protein
MAAAMMKVGSRRIGLYPNFPGGRPHGAWFSNIVPREWGADFLDDSRSF